MNLEMNFASFKGCVIGGVCYLDGSNKRDLQCQTCNSDKNRKGWTQKVSL